MENTKMTNEELTDNVSDELSDSDMKQDQSEENTSTETDENEEGSALEEKDEVEKLKDEIEELNQKYLRLYSEFDNFRKRTQKEKLELYKTAGEDILLAMLPVLDNLERAMKSIHEATDIESVKKGIDLIHQNLYSVLSQKGLKAMDSSIHKEFDLDNHEAITRIPAPEKKLKGKVIDEIEKGYLLHDKVIRYAKVVIGE